MMSGTRATGSSDIQITLLGGKKKTFLITPLSNEPLHSPVHTLDLGCEYIQTMGHKRRIMRQVISGPANGHRHLCGPWVGGITGFYKNYSVHLLEFKIHDLISLFFSPKADLSGSLWVYFVVSLLVGEGE